MMASEKTATIQFTCSGPGINGKLILDGQDISRFSRAVEIRADVHGLPTAKVEMLARQGLDVVLDAEVNVQISVFPGFVLVAEPKDDGSTRYRVEREEKDGSAR